MNPPALFPNSHPRLVLMEHWRLDQRRFELLFHRGKMVVTGFDETGNAPSRELHSKQIVKQLAGTSIRYRLTFHQGDRQRLNASPILGRGFDRCGKAGSCQTKTRWTLFFFNPVLRHPEPLHWQVDHLTSLWQPSFPIVEILLTVLALFDWMQDYRVRGFYLLEMMSTMAPLAAWLFAALLPQAFGSWLLSLVSPLCYRFLSIRMASDFIKIRGH